MRRHAKRMKILTSVVWLPFFLTVLSGGCSTFKRSVSDELGPLATGDDHFEAALMYRKRADQLELEALKFDAEAERLTPAEDTKGFRRDGLRTAAEQHRKDAKDLRTRAEEHQRMAERLFEAPRQKASPPPPP